MVSFDDELHITEREKERLGTGINNLRSLLLNTFPYQISSFLAKYNKIVIHHQNYHDITNFMNLTTFTLYKTLKTCIISVNAQVMKRHNKDPGPKSLPPPKSSPQK